MNTPKRYISLDISTNTGYAIFDDNNLIKYGVFTKKVKDYKADIKSYKDFPENYPYNYLVTANTISAMCLNIILDNNIDTVIIEHPEQSKQRMSQRLLEWVHLSLVQKLKRLKIPFKYILVKDWRQIVNCYIKHWPDLHAQNKEIRKIKNKTGKKIAMIEGKRVGKVNQKKLSILIANNTYSLNIKNDNIADAINMGRAAYELQMI
jgi:uncharacterized protein YaeQ